MRTKTETSSAAKSISYGANAMNASLPTLPLLY